MNVEAVEFKHFWNGAQRNLKPVFEGETDVLLVYVPRGIGRRDGDYFRFRRPHETENLAGTVSIPYEGNFRGRGRYQSIRKVFAVFLDPDRPAHKRAIVNRDNQRLVLELANSV